MISCGNKSRLGEHTHDSVAEVKICYGILAATAAAPPPPPPARIVGSRTNPDGASSPSQLKYINDLGGYVDWAKTQTYGVASKYIGELIAKKRGAVPVIPVGYTPPPPRKHPLEDDSRLPILKGLLPVLGDKGYYAVPRMNSDTELTFFRIHKRKSGKLNGAYMVQSKHSDELIERFVFWPSGKVSFHTERRDYIDELLLVLADPAGAALRYSEHYHTCCRCNKDLTDDRSRWYNIGPDCEEFWPQIIEKVNDSEKGPFRG